LRGSINITNFKYFRLQGMATALEYGLLLVHGEQNFWYGAWLESGAEAGSLAAQGLY
jgi:hypothetical protein